MIQRVIALILALAAFALPTSALASIPSLDVAPLKYEQRLDLGKSQAGYIDVSNPGDTTITVTSKVQAFRQIDTQGNLQFYDDERLSAGVHVDLASFDLGPREAVRVAFTIDPAKLGEGGAYGVIFFKTKPKQQSGAGVQLQTSAQVGTLLLLNVGSGGTTTGTIAKLSTHLLAFSKTIIVDYSYKNTGDGSKALAFTPNLQMRVGWSGKWQTIASGLVSPSLTRTFQAAGGGNHFGLFPVTVRDTTLHTSRTAWVFGAIGAGGLAGLVILFAALAAGLYLWWSRRR